MDILVTTHDHLNSFLPCSHYGIIANRTRCCETRTHWSSMHQNSIKICQRTCSVGPAWRVLAEQCRGRSAWACGKTGGGSLWPLRSPALSPHRWSLCERQVYREGNIKLIQSSSEKQDRVGVKILPNLDSNRACLPIGPPSQTSEC